MPRNDYQQSQNYLIPNPAKMEVEILISLPFSFEKCSLQHWFQHFLKFFGWALLLATIDLLSYSIASGIPVTLTRVKCWNINHQNHKHTYSHEVRDQNDRSNRCNTLYGCDDWYFSIWHVSMSQEFHWQLSNWVGPISL